MKKLKLSTIKWPHYEPRPLSMDEYFKFVQTNLKNLDRKAYAKEKRLLAVDVPFKLK